MAPDLPPADADPMTVAEAFATAWDAQDLETVLALVADDCVFESARPGTNGERVQGREELRRVWGPSFVPSDASMETEATFSADGGRVVQLWRFAAGDTVVRGVDVLRVRDGRICEKLGYVKA
jgi:ketosteroid isomerase-like protein